MYIGRDDPFAGNDYFSAQQNAELVRNAEEYYRAMFRGRPNTWNLRDRHMFETLEKLSAHLETRLGTGAAAKPLGTQLSSGQCGRNGYGATRRNQYWQLVTEKYGRSGLRIGFSTSRARLLQRRIGTLRPEPKPYVHPCLGVTKNCFPGLRKILLPRSDS